MVFYRVKLNKHLTTVYSYQQTNNSVLPRTARDQKVQYGPSSRIWKKYKTSWSTYFRIKQKHLANCQLREHMYLLLNLLTKSN